MTKGRIENIFNKQDELGWRFLENKYKNKVRQVAN